MHNPNGRAIISFMVYEKLCTACGNLMYRQKKSESTRPNWLYCSRSCKASFLIRKKSPLLSRQCLNCLRNFEYKKWSSPKFCSRQCGLWFRNKNNNPAKSATARLKISTYAKSNHSQLRTKAARLKQAKSISGEGHWNWQGGKTPESKLIRSRVEIKEWRKSVFERDNYTCQECGIRGTYLEADHIKPFAYFPELRLS